MAYNNTETTSSISNQFGTWRYFNSAIQKLNTYKPTPVSISQPKAIIKQQTDWAGVALNVANGALGLFEARKEASYKKADEYLKTHSLQEYRKAMSQGAVPFQDDPLAMQRLKYNHGKIVFQLSEQEFLDKVNKGDFIGLEPQQVDAKHFEHSKKAMADVAEAFPYFDAQTDYWFKEGFFADSPKSRLGVVVKNSQVANDAFVKQSIIQTNARVTSLMNSGATPTEVLGALDQARVQLGKRASIQQVDDLVKVITGSAANSVNGYETLVALKGYKIPGTEITFGDYLGTDAYNALLIKAQNKAQIANGAQVYRRNDQVRTLVANGNVSAITAMRDEQLRRNGGVKTPVSDWLDSMITQAQIVARNQAGQQAKEVQKQAQSTAYSMWLMSYLRGQQVPTQEWVRQNISPKLTAVDRQVIQQQATQRILSNGTPEEKYLLLSKVAQSNAPSQMRSVVGGFVNDMYTDLMMQIDQSVRTGVLPVARDQNGNPLADYQYKIPGQSNAVKKIKFMPKSFRTLMDFYSLNPSAVNKILYASNQKVWQTVQNADLAIRMGDNPVRFLSDIRSFEQAGKRQAGRRGTSYVSPAFPFNKVKIQGLQDVRIHSQKVNDTATAVVMARARVYLQKNPKANFRQAFKAGAQQVASEVIGVNNFIVPIYQLGSFVPEGAKMDNEELADFANSSFANIMKANGLTKKNDYASSYYDQHSNSIKIVSDLGQLKGEVKIQDLGKKMKQSIEEDRKNSLGLFSQLFK